MSHAGRRIASTAAAAAAVALPVAAAGSAHADALPLVGSLPVVGSLTQSQTADHLTQALPLAGLPVVGGLTGQQENGASPLNALPVVGGLAGSGLPDVASLTGNGGASPLSGLPVVGGLTNSLGKGGLPLSGLPVVGGLTGSAAGQGGAADMSSSTESVPMQQAQSPTRDDAAAQAPAASSAQQPVVSARTGTDAQKLTTHYAAKHRKA